MRARADGCDASHSGAGIGATKLCPHPMFTPSSLSAFTAVSLAVAMAYLLASTLLAGVGLVLRSRRAAKASLYHQPAAFIVLEADGIDRRLRRHRTAVLLFAVCFGILALLGRQHGWPELPTWGWVTVAMLVAVVGTFAAAKAVQLVRYRRRLQSLLDADRVVAQRLDEVQLRGHRVFHAVPVGDSIIDHVVVGPIGVFAIQVVLPARPGAVTVSLARGSLTFGPGHGTAGLQPVIRGCAGLARELGRTVGHPVKIVPTLVVPGCKVVASDEERFLLTNEQNCVALVGWKDSAAYLMDDEVARISQWLAGRCQPRQQFAWRLPKRTLHASIARPRLV